MPAPARTAINAALDGLTYTRRGFQRDDTLDISVVDSTTVGTGPGTATASVDISVAYPPPDLTAPDDMTVAAGSTVTLTATASSEAGIASVAWLFSYEGGDYVVDPTLTTLSVPYTFDQYGDYDVLVEVTDTNGQVSEDGFSVTVTEDAPSAAASASPNPAPEGSVVTFTVQVAPDPDSLDTISIYADWEGTDEWQQVDPTEWTDNGDGSVSFDHYFDVQGTYPSVIEVEDDGGQVASYTIPIVITGVAPTGELVKLGDPTHLDQNLHQGGLAVPGTLVEFENVEDPSDEELGGLKYYWKVDSGGWQETDTADFLVPNSDDAQGTVTTVTGYIEDGFGNKSPQQTVDLLYSKAGLGTFALADGSVSTTPTNSTVTVQNVAMGSQVSLVFTPDNVAEVWPPPGERLEYSYTVAVYDVEQTSLRDAANYLGLGGGTSTMLSVSTFPSFSPNITVTMPNLKDREVAVLIHPFLPDAAPIGISGGGWLQLFRRQLDHI